MLGWFQRKKKKATIARAHYQKENVGNDASALPYAQLGDLNSSFAPKNKKAGGKAAPKSNVKTRELAKTTDAVVETEFTRPDVPAQAGSGLLKKNEK